MTMLSDKQIELLEEKGFRRWLGGGTDRLYISPLDAGLECACYKSGRSATWRGKPVPAAKAKEIILDGQYSYIDLESGEICSRSSEMRELMALLLEGVRVICPAPEAEAMEER